MPAKYIKKQHSIEAIRYIGENNEEEVRNFCRCIRDLPAVLPSLIMYTKESRQIVVSPGEWIIYDKTKEYFTACTDESFCENYVMVSAS